MPCAAINGYWAVPRAFCCNFFIIFSQSGIIRSCMLAQVSCANIQFCMLARLYFFAVESTICITVIDNPCEYGYLITSF
jgi:hypothetical protein